MVAENPEIKTMLIGGRKSERLLELTAEVDAAEDVRPGALAFHFLVQSRKGGGKRFMLATTTQSLREHYPEDEWEIVDVGLALPRVIGEPWKPIRLVIEG